MLPSSPATPPGGSPATAGSAARGAVRGSERSLAPDLARGAVLLFVALANVSTYFYGRDLEPA